MKVVLLAGGRGERISEYSSNMPKPLIEIGGKPIIWHIMKVFSSCGYNDFIICCGYKGDMIKKYFYDYYLQQSDVIFDFTSQKNDLKIIKKYIEPWRITVVDTGMDTMTGGRIKRIAPYINKNEPFIVTYSDGLSDINLNELVNFHMRHGKKATITAVEYTERFGVMNLKGEQVIEFREKRNLITKWINAGFMVFDYDILNLLDGDDTVLEGKPLEALAESNELMAYKHTGFWKCMDTNKDKIELEEMWKSNALWRIWDD